jgi:hypothetical protein
MKISSLFLLSSTLILTSCGKKEDDKKSDSSNTSTKDSRNILKEGTIINDNIDLQKKILGTSWTLSKTLDHENKEVKNNNETKLSFAKDNNVLNIKNTNGNVFLCGIAYGGKYVIVKSSIANEYLIQDFNHSCALNTDDGKIIPSMAIIKINKDNSISIYREILTDYKFSKGKFSPSVIQTETYIKNK